MTTQDTLEEIQSLLDNGQINEAEDKSRKLFEENKDNLEVLITLARVLVMNEKTDDALELLKEASEQNPQDYYPPYLMGFIKEDQKEFDDAIKYYKQALSLKPNSGHLNYRLGFIYDNSEYKKKNEYSALSYLRNSITGDNPPEEAYLKLAALEPRSRAVYILQSGIEKYPSDEFLITALCSKLYQLEDYRACIQNIESAKDKSVTSSTLQGLKALSYYQLHEYEQAINEVEQIDVAELQRDIHLRAFQALLQIEARQYSAAEQTLKDMIASDIKDTLGFAGHILLVCRYLREGKNEEASKVFKEIPLTTRFDSPILLFITYSEIVEIDHYFLEAINWFISSNSTDSDSAKYLKAVYIYSSQTNAGKLNPEQLGEIKKDFVNSLSFLGRERADAYDLLYHISVELKDWIDAAYYYFLSQMHEEDDTIYFEIESVLVQISKSPKNIEKLFSTIEKVMDEFSYFEDRFSKKCLPQLIGYFHSKQKYELVVRLAKIFPYKSIFRAESIFEVAYAYNELGNKKQAKNYYRAYTKDIGENSAVMNNLALLEEGDGNLIEAERLFQAAINLDPNDDIAKNNHERIAKRLQKEEEQRRAYQKAADLYQQELESARLLATKLFSTRTADGAIYLNEEKVSSLTGLDADEIEFRVNDLIKKKYFEEVSKSETDFDGKLLRTNPVIIPFLENDLKKFSEKESMDVIASNLLSDSLEEKYGYGKVLLDNLSVIKSSELSKMLERDLYETVVSLVVKSYKSTLILCGSIIEAILLDQLSAREKDAIIALDRIYSKEGKQLKSDDKFINRWVLDRLLDVALELRVVSENLYHWGHGLRGFRNLVHPGVEQRQTMEVSRENAEMAWNVVKRLLNEIKAKEEI